MEPSAVEQLIRDVAEQVIRPRWCELRPSEIDEKRPGDFVTAADREAEALLTRALLIDDPDAVVVGEEATFADPSRADRLTTAAHAWTVDPVDGTKNFVHGSPDYAVMVAELRDGEVVASWIYQPEHDVMFAARRGEGVFRNGERIEVAGAREPLIGAASRKPPVGRSGEGISPIQRTAWCCGVDYPKLARGEWDFIAYSHAKPWDHLPGALMVRELGGVVRIPGAGDYDGSPDKGGVLAARTPEAWERVAGLLSTIPQR